MMAGTLIICSTPIGNLGDVSERLAVALTEADVVYAEDTRRTGKLLSVLGISTPLRSYFIGKRTATVDRVGWAFGSGGNHRVGLGCGNSSRL